MENYAGVFFYPLWKLPIFEITVETWNFLTQNLLLQKVRLRIMKTIFVEECSYWQMCICISGRRLMTMSVRVSQTENTRIPKYLNLWTWKFWIFPKLQETIHQYQNRCLEPALFVRTYCRLTVLEFGILSFFYLHYHLKFELFMQIYASSKFSK